MDSASVHILNLSLFSVSVTGFFETVSKDQSNYNISLPKKINKEYLKFTYIYIHMSSTDSVSRSKISKKRARIFDNRLTGILRGTASENYKSDKWEVILTHFLTRDPSQARLLETVPKIMFCEWFDQNWTKKLDPKNGPNHSKIRFSKKP